MFVPLSIPSPSAAWQYFDVTAWLNSTFGASLPGSLRIHAYAICILVGIVAAVIITNHRLNRQGAEKGIVIDVAIWAVVFGIAGGRLFHVITHPADYFSSPDQYIHVLFVWEGGLAIYGALLLGAVGVWLGCRFTGLRFTVFADALAPGLLVAQAFGRLGNWFNHELFGMPTDLPWGLEIESTNAAYPTGLPEGTLFHPTFLYEIVWMLAGVALLLLLEKKAPMQWGRSLAFYLVWYGIGRAWFESIRTDPSLLFFGIRTNVWMSFFAVVLGIVLFVVAARRHTGTVPGPYVPGRAPSERASAVDSDDTYTENDEPELVTVGASDDNTDRSPRP
ncbi:prolipoprotein diacylglyceryl transferase [Frigoribacterium sp. MCBA15_019]|uniref:prolipoprotein diacylglyceryl transferase n=1 Tax=unclassified Frigoribacterium TaxID=2627005 RepID=UPI0008DDBF0F|nr:prolipoprotein diacylglyceryl transferase [Frigoribacterium sp. MCBA15_019]OII27174.1 prolipoprotein diacylglyceryl transferase [Frigoribacterium sp. MCBA15_019]